MKSIVWLASYPKSGNTWFRAFLTHLLIRGTKHEFDINKLVCRMHSSRSFLDDALELDSSMLSAREILELMPEVYIHYANETAERIYFKSHEKRYHVAGGRWNIPAEVTEKALYFVRNPLEVAVSYAHHNQVTIDESIARMTNPLAMLANPPHRYASQAPQWIGDWSSNVRSWLDAEGIDVLVLRYEDMVFDASATFGKAVEFLGFQISIEELADVLERCSFKELKEMEDVNGFGERNPKTSCFFRTGQTDSWKTSLTDRQREAIVESHGPMMTRLGYFE